MTDVLVTGASGFVGTHLSDALVRGGHRLIGTYHPTQQKPDRADVKWVPWDLKDSILPLLNEFRPKHLYHLASPAHVPSTSAAPAQTVDAILGATVRFAGEIKGSSVERMLYASSAEVYAPPRDGLPIDEDHPIEPRAIYGICKAAASQYLLNELRDIVTVIRPFNQIGPGQTPIFAVASFAKQIADIARGEGAAVLKVGNLAVERDFSDIRDTATAHILALEKGRGGTTYNVASGVATSLRSLVEAMIERSGKAIAIEVDPARLRGNEPAVIVGNANKLRQDTGWAPKSTAIIAAIDAYTAVSR